MHPGRSLGTTSGERGSPCSVDMARGRYFLLQPQSRAVREGPATSMSREATLCLMVAADVTPVLSSPDSKPPAWAFVGDDASLAAHVRNAPNHRDRSTVATMYRPEHPWPHYSASGSGVPSSREAPSETRRPDRDWSCEPTSYRCSRPGVIDNRCHGAAENDAGQDAVRTESSRSVQTLPSIGSPRHRHPATTGPGPRPPAVQPSDRLTDHLVGEVASPTTWTGVVSENGATTAHESIHTSM